MSPFSILAGLALWLLVLALPVMLRRARTGLPIFRPVLVLKKFRLDEAPANGVILDIAGRPAGLVAWMMTLLGIDTETLLQVTPTNVRAQNSSLTGVRNTFMPLPHVEAAITGYHRPVGYLGVAIAILLFGALGSLESIGSALRPQPQPTFWQPAPPPPQVGQAALVSIGGTVVTLLIAGVFVLAYWLNRRMTVAISSGDLAIGLSFKPSVIEGVTLDLARVRAAVAAVERRILEAQLTPEAASAWIGTLTTSRRPRPPVRQPTPRSCDQCATPLANDSLYCESCGAAVAPVASG